MKLFRIYLSTLLILGSLSCKETNPYIKEFPSSAEIAPSFIPIQEIIKMESIYRTEDYIIIRNADVNAEYFFYVYSYPDFKFLYPLGKLGNGPEEYLMPTVIKNTPNNTFEFRDHATDKYAIYQLCDTAAIPIKTYTFQPDKTRFFWEINYINENQYLLKRSSSKLSTRELWDFSTHSLLDSLPNTFDLAKKMGKNYYTEFDDMWISSYKKKMAFAYFFIDRIEIGSIEGEKMKLDTFVGVEKAPDFHLFKKGSQEGKYKYNVEYNTVHYEYLTCTENYIFALYAGMPWGDLDKYHSSVIEIYDWNGNAIKKLNLKQSISSFVVDEKRKQIYGLSPEVSEDAILIYSY